MESSHRRLPHHYPEGKWLYITWSLYNALPSARFPPPGKATAGRAFVWMDRYLDTTRTAPFFLRQAPIAKIVCDSSFRGEQLGHYQLGPFVIMPNHVHVLPLAKIAPAHIPRSLKGATARASNLVLRRTGESFWQKESYDHWVRNAVEWEKITQYIEQNPVRAGLAAYPEDFRWSSACVETSLDAARISACATLKR